MEFINKTMYCINKGILVIGAKLIFHPFWMLFTFTTSLKTVIPYILHNYRLFYEKNICFYEL